MKTVNRLRFAAMAGAALLAWAGARAEVDTAWTGRVQTIAYYEGDEYGTVCQDIYINASNIYQQVNFNGQGLNLHWTNSGEPERPGYVRFENIFSQIPAGSFILEATLELTASSNSTGAGHVKIGARGPFGFSETNASYVTGGGNVALLNRTSLAASGNFDQLYSRSWGTALSNGVVVSAPVGPSVRAWFDYHQDKSYGYTNAGFAININNQGAGGNANATYFYDSEAADTNVRPRLIVRYLPAGCGYRAFIYQPVPSNTPQVVKTAIQDAFIRNRDGNQGVNFLHTNNYGGQVGVQLVRSDDGPPSLMIRWPALQKPAANLRVAEARIRYSGSDNWNQGQQVPITLQIRQCYRDWVEGTGTTAKASYENVTYTNFNAVAGDPSLNLWQMAGGIGALDSTNLANVSSAYGEGVGPVGSDAFTDLVAGWLDGDGTNNGVMLRLVSGTGLSVLYGNLGGSHWDPYFSIGLMVVYREIAPGTLLQIR